MKLVRQMLVLALIAAVFAAFNLSMYQLFTAGFPTISAAQHRRR